MAKRLSTRLAALLLAGLILTSCFGNFSLTRTVYGLNSRVENAYIRSAVTWVFVIMPVYQLAATADFLVLNVIQFWTGTNPLRASHVESDGTTFASSHEIIDGEDVLVFREITEGGETPRLEFRRLNDVALHARVLTPEGELLNQSVFPMDEMSAEKLAALALLH